MQFYLFTKVKNEAEYSLKHFTSKFVAGIWCSGQSSLELRVASVPRLASMPRLQTGLPTLRLD